MNDEPHDPQRRQKLVYPYFSGSGKDFANMFMFHEGPTLHHGMVLSTDKDDLIVVKETSRIDEDFFENITVTLCQLMTNSSHDEVDLGARELYYMYSASSEK